MQNPREWMARGISPPSFYLVWHNRIGYTFVAFMDDYGQLVKVDYEAYKAFFHQGD